MALLALGLNHQTAPLEVRERVAFTPDRAEAALRGLKRLPGLHGAALLSTCNRTELYCALEPGAEHRPLAWLEAEQRHALSPYVYRHHDAAAVRHAFRVAAGLDSMILGEPQILGQLKDAYQRARAADTLAPPLEHLFQSSFAIAKRVRQETGLGASAVSVAYAATQVVRQVFDDLPRRTALLLGAGDTAELLARHLRGRGLVRLLVANRTVERAVRLAERIGAQAVNLSAMGQHLPEADIVVTATAAEHYLLTVEQIRAALKARRRLLLLLDLGVPRNIDPAAAELDDVILYSIDDFQKIADSGLEQRRRAAAEAELLIEEQVGEFMRWLEARARLDDLKRIRRHHESIRDRLLARALHRLEHGAEPRELLHELAHRLTNTLQHGPTVAQRSAAAQGDDELMSLLRRLYPTTPVEHDEPGAD